MEGKIYQVLKHHKLPLKKREAVLKDLLSLFNISAFPYPNIEFKRPFRVGKKQNRVVLDANGKELITFPKGKEMEASVFCSWINNR